MSADNGIYILETNSSQKGNLLKAMAKEEKEYRVREMQCIENIEYDRNAPEPIPPSLEHSVYEFRPEDKKHVAYQDAYRAKYHSTNPDVLIANARQMWRGCKVFTDKSKALLYAADLERKANDEYYLEYGISFIRIDRVF